MSGVSRCGRENRALRIACWRFGIRLSADILASHSLAWRKINRRMRNISERMCVVRQRQRKSGERVRAGTGLKCNPMDLFITFLRLVTFEGPHAKLCQSRSREIFHFAERNLHHLVMCSRRLFAPAPSALWLTFCALDTRKRVFQLQGAGDWKCFIFAV